MTPTSPVTLSRELSDALDVLRGLDAKHFPTTREKRPGWEVCDHDSMTWPCDTQKALDAFEPWYAASRAVTETPEGLTEARERVTAYLDFLDRITGRPDRITGISGTDIDLPLLRSDLRVLTAHKEEHGG